MSTPAIIEDTAPEVSPDAQLVTAVRAGDSARYRELVERHQRRVYAVAWSRLGDATLAEEATQEAFIRAYRNLPLLGDGAKFPAWISAIARNLAITLGLRHRRELNKRERWALEQPTSEAATVTQEEFCPPETLRKSLAELPDAHRECLVLFYLEGKSGAEAAVALDITETALRMRLSRARVALREKLEERLGESLEQLRPPSTLVPSVMAVVATTKMKAGGGIGAVVAVALGKVLPWKFLPFFAPLVGVVPSLGFSWWMGKSERRNYRDETGFRARLHREFFLSFMWGFVVLNAVIILGVFVVMRYFGFLGLFLALGFSCVLLAAAQARLFVINRTRFQISNFIYVIMMGLAALAVGLGWIPILAFNFTLPVLSLLMVWACRDRPIRMDYNLFLRAGQGMLARADEAVERKPLPHPLDKKQLLAFARFLCSRFLVNDFRWTPAGLQLRMPPAKISFIGNILGVFLKRWHHWSLLTLSWNGSIRAELRPGDEAALQKSIGASLPPSGELEAQVAGAVQLAWRDFTRDKLESAERALGQLPESEVFKVPPSSTPAIRWTIAVMAVLAVGAVVLGWSIWDLESNKRVAEPLQAQFAADYDKMGVLVADINRRTGQINQWLWQVRKLEAQAVQAAPADAEGLRMQIADLQAKIKDGNLQVERANQLVEQLQRDAGRLQAQITQLLQPKAAKPGSPK